VSQRGQGGDAGLILQAVNTLYTQRTSSKQEYNHTEESSLKSTIVTVWGITCLASFLRETIRPDLVFSRKILMFREFEFAFLIAHCPLSVCL
jgi:hypothetical protein